MDLPWVGRGHLRVEMSTVEDSVKGDGDGEPRMGLKKTYQRMSYVGGPYDKI